MIKLSKSIKQKDQDGAIREGFELKVIEELISSNRVWFEKNGLILFYALKHYVDNILTDDA